MRHDWHVVLEINSDLMITGINDQSHMPLVLSVPGCQYGHFPNGLLTSHSELADGSNQAGWNKGWAPEDPASTGQPDSSICLAQILLHQQAHIGGHILCSVCGVHEELKKLVGSFDIISILFAHLVQVGDTLPCGFCGESGHAACNIYIQVKKDSVKCTTNCCLATNIKYAFAECGSDNTPCRNIPIHARGREGSKSQPAQWQYNMEEHLARDHPEYASPCNPDGRQCLPHTVWVSMELDQQEHLAAGIPLSQIPSPFDRVAGPDEGVDDLGQQMGVRYRAPMRAAPTGKGKVKGVGKPKAAVNKSATGTADAPERPPQKKRKSNSGAPIASGSGSVSGLNKNVQLRQWEASGEKEGLEKQIILGGHYWHGVDGQVATIMWLDFFTACCLISANCEEVAEKNLLDHERGLGSSEGPMLIFYSIQGPMLSVHINACLPPSPERLGQES
ncbi:hypothetical protein B0H17DRAFT_1149654 [Mycena rosella]|uniref:Uncharacterized protein n=1 Tax=Mycena rosella TaxID=1033263 RepID=A0AAD7C0N0_MYCRO|nr:hypothetical protein B0H17DRAFT_1149654 [Mycena rosella]